MIKHYTCYGTRLLLLTFCRFVKLQNCVGFVGGFAISQMCCYRFGAVYFVNNFIW